MLFIARFFAGLLFLGCIVGILGVALDGKYVLAISTVPFVYFFWLIWQILKPVDMGRFKFCLAHLSPGYLILLGLIFLFAPNKILGFMASGVGLICVAGMLIHQMHAQRKVIKAASA